jgi:predicted metal-dependent hydrolase
MRRLSGFFRKPPEPDAPADLIIDGRPVRVELRRNAQARRFVLRMARDGRSAVLTLPRRAARADALAFAERSKPWIATQMMHRPAAERAAVGATVSYRGIPHRIEAAGVSRGLVRHDPESRLLTVPGEGAHLPRRLEDWLKAEARAALEQAVPRYGAAMGVVARRITIRDQQSRWGSCSASGELSFSWRLIMAPPHVLDYVAAHEVAHLREMNHGPRFWRLVLTHCPAAGEAKRWLKANGHSLHRLAAARP